VLHAIGMFDPAELTNVEKAQDPAEYRTWFCLGETCMAALLAADIAVPAGFWFAGITALPLAFIGAAVLFLLLFVLSKVIRPERGEDHQVFDLSKVIRPETREELIRVLRLPAKTHPVRHEGGHGRRFEESFRIPLFLELRFAQFFGSGRVRQKRTDTEGFLGPVRRVESRQT
jgi:hypothetical protein